jgi:hypothetical protein
MTKINWNDENTARLVELAGPEGSEVSREVVANVAEELGTSTRSVGAKLRNLNYTVAPVAAKQSDWSESDEAELRSLVEGNANTMTYDEIAAAFQNGRFSRSQVQGKILSLELFSLVKKAERKAPARTYSEEEEARFVEMAKSGASIEAITAEMGREMMSIRGKALSLFKAGLIDAMPKQESSKAKEKGDVLDGVDVESLSVAEIAEQTGKTERGIKTILTRRGLNATDYAGATRKEKLEAKEA